MQLTKGPCRAHTLCRGCDKQAVTARHAARRQVVRAGASADDILTRRAVLISTCLLPVLGTSFPTAAAEPEAEIKLPMPGSNPYEGVLRLPGDFLRARQKVNGGEKILAPIRASQRKLKDAESILGAINIYDPNPTLYREALKTIRMASLNCYGFEALAGDTLETRASLLQRKIGVADACTFRLIAKNVTSLLPASKKKLKADTNTQLQDLIRSYELLDDRLTSAWHGESAGVEGVPAALQVTLAHTASFETMIERCLDLPPSNVAPSAMSTLTVERLRRLWARAPPQ